MSVSHILQAKGRTVTTARPADSVKHVAEILAKRRIGAVIISGDGTSIDGIVSERDIVRVVAEQGAAALSGPVSAIMTRPVKTCSEDDSETELMAMMTQSRIRHLPVLTQGKLAGMISIGDVVKFRVEAIERDAAAMKDYIAGS